MLLDSGAKVDYQRKDGATALITASANGHLDAVKLLLDQKANLDIGDENGTSPLMFASAHGDFRVVELLLDAGANADHQNKEGKTALMWASFFGNTDVVRLLLDRNATPQLEDVDGFNFINIMEQDADGVWSVNAEQQEAAAQLLDYFELLRKEMTPIANGVPAESNNADKSEL
jgi:ankyrin repeat protein